MTATRGRSRRGLAGPVGSLSSQPMVTLGVDLASQAKRTAVCLIRWDGESADVDCLRTDVTDSDLLELFGRPSQGPDKIAIDAPFGWPENFVRAIHAYSSSTVWPSVDDLPPPVEENGPGGEGEDTPGASQPFRRGSDRDDRDASCPSARKSSRRRRSHRSERRRWPILRSRTRRQPSGFGDCRVGATRTLAPRRRKKRAKLVDDLAEKVGLLAHFQRRGSSLGVCESDDMLDALVSGLGRSRGGESAAANRSPDEDGRSGRDRRAGSRCRSRIVWLGGPPFVRIPDKATAKGLCHHHCRHQTSLHSLTICLRPMLTFLESRAPGGASAASARQHALGGFGGGEYAQGAALQSRIVPSTRRRFCTRYRATFWSNLQCSGPGRLPQGLLGPRKDGSHETADAPDPER